MQSPERWLDVVPFPGRSSNACKCALDELLVKINRWHANVQWISVVNPRPNESRSSDVSHLFRQRVTNTTHRTNFIQILVSIQRHTKELYVVGRSICRYIRINGWNCRKSSMNWKGRNAEDILWDKSDKSDINVTKKITLDIKLTCLPLIRAIFLGSYYCFLFLLFARLCQSLQHHLPNLFRWIVDALQNTKSISSLFISIYWNRSAGHRLICFGFLILFSYCLAYFHIISFLLPHWRLHCS